ncbi:MAG: OpcA/G6PD domain-containing protein [Candidatus Tyrphobacter sp.]
MNADVHVATMSLIVFFENEALSTWARSRAHLIADRHASSVLVLDGAASQGSHSEDHWREAGVAGCSPDEIASLIASLPSDLPRTLLWVASNTASDERFMRLAPESRTILLDSSRARDDGASLRDLTVLRAREAGVVSFHDLAYLRLAPWQELVADLFDGRAFVDDLFDLKRVCVAVGSDAEGYYLLGWLASRLGWDVADGCKFVARKGAREIAYEIEREGQARRVKRIVLESQASRFCAELSSKDSGAVCLAVTGAKQRPTRVEPLHDIDVASLFERAILHEQPDPVFFESLDVAAKLLACG